MSKQRITARRIPFDLAKLDTAPDTGVKDLGVVVLPVVLTRAEMARVFGKSATWLDAYLTHEGVPLNKHMRVVNGRKMWLTKAVLEFIEALV